MNEVWVLLYSNQYGSDISVYSTKEKAAKAGIEIMKRWQDDLEDRWNLDTTIVKQVEKALKQDDFNTARDLWNTHTEESIMVFNTIVDQDENQDPE